MSSPFMTAHAQAQREREKWREREGECAGWKGFWLGFEDSFSEFAKHFKIFMSY